MAKEMTLMLILLSLAPVTLAWIVFLIYCGKLC